MKILAVVVVLKLAVMSSLAFDVAVSGLERGTGPGRTEDKVIAALSAEAIAAPAEAQEKGLEPEANASKPGDDEAPGGLERELLLKKQEELAAKEKALAALEQELDQKLVRLQELEAKLNRMLEDAKEVRDKKLKHLIDVYSNMKAKQAAAVIETLNEKIAVKILAGMRGRQAGEILTYVKPAKAARLSEQLTKMQVPF